MAFGVAPGDGRETPLYTGKMTLFVVLSCVTAAMGGLIFGYDIGISGGVTSMESFLRKFFPEVYRKMREDTGISNYCKFDSQKLTAFTSALYIAGLVASFIASFVTSTCGRKTSMIIGGTAFLAGSAFGGAATNLYMLILGRVLLGVGVGFGNQSALLYISEMSPARYRGAFTNGFQFCVGLGVLFANLINYGVQKIRAGWGWRISLSAVAVPTSLFTAGAILLPDTPNSLLQRTNNVDNATKLLRKIRGTPDVGDELDGMIRATAIASTMHHPFRKILQLKYRPQLVMAVAMPFFQQVTGINVIGFYAPVFFRTIGLGESAALMSSVAPGVVGLGGTFMSMALVDRSGRRGLFVVGGAQMFVSLMAVGGILAAELGDHGEISKGCAMAVLVLICIYVFGFGWSWGPLGWLVPSEIFPLEIRSAGQSITVAVSFLFTSAVAQTLLTMLCHFKAGIFFFFGGWVMVMTLFVYLLLPETKGRRIEEMDRVWREHWFWKNVVADEERASNNAREIEIESKA